MPDDDGLRPRWQTLTPSLTERFLSSENWRKRFLQNESRSGVTVKFRVSGQRSPGFVQGSKPTMKVVVTRTGYLTARGSLALTETFPVVDGNSIIPLP